MMQQSCSCCTLRAAADGSNCGLHLLQSMCQPQPPRSARLAALACTFSDSWYTHSWKSGLGSCISAFSRMFATTLLLVAAGLIWYSRRTVRFASRLYVPWATCGQCVEVSAQMLGHYPGYCTVQIAVCSWLKYYDS
jgi:hypothetical protein